jgi:glycosyltransferase involved in cell wall biosynthesis
MSQPSANGSGAPRIDGSVASISVLMPTWNGEEFLERVLAALAAQRCALPWDVLVVDSGSKDRTLAILGEWQARFPVPLRVQHIHQCAFDHGDTRNLLAVESRGDLLVYLTQDAIPSGPDWLATLASNFEDPRVGAAYSRNLPRPDAEVLTRVFSEHDPGYTAGRREQKLPDIATYAGFGPHEKRLLFNCNDVAAAYRRDLWRAHPFPRTEFGEDLLMARALIEAGYTVVYDDVATVEHSHDYGPDEMRKRCRIDGKFNVEWLGRVCVASRHDAEILTKRQLERDREALTAAGVTGAALTSELQRAEALRRAAFLGLYEGGASTKRYPETRLGSTGPLRLLYVVHGFPPDTWAGTEVYTLGLAKEMARRGHEVAILTRAPAAKSVAEGGPEDFSVVESEFQGLRVFRMTHRLQHGSLRESYHQPRAEAAFRDVVVRYAPDLVHFQHLIHMSAGLPHVCSELGIPTVITVNDYWALCPRVQLIRPDAVRCEESQGLGCLLCVKDKNYDQIPSAKRFLPVVEPFVGLLHAAAGVPGLGPIAQMAGEFRDMSERLDFTCGGYSACDLVIAPSRFLREKLLGTERFDPHRVLYSDYGTLMDNIRPIERKPDPEGRVRIGYVGSLLWYKGVDVLVRAMTELAGKKITLHVYGEFKPDQDEYHAKLAQLADAAPGMVVFHGRFDNNRIADVYEQIDALVVPSTWFENSPITIHESFLFRTPVITSDIGGMAELVRDEVDGLHFAVGDAKDLARQLGRLVDDSGLLGRLATPRPVKTMEEDAREMEVRYRGLRCRVRETGPSKLVDRGAHPYAAAGGTVERQGAAHVLLRPGGWVEYDAASLGPGRYSLGVDVVLYAGEGAIPLAAVVTVDDVEVARLGALRASSSQEVRRQTVEIELQQSARRLRIAADPTVPGAHFRLTALTVREAEHAAATVAPRH